MKPESFLTLFVVIYMTSCSQIDTPEPHIVKVRGSESMFEAFEALSNDFESTQDTVKIQIEGGGSRTGLNAIRNNEAHMGLSSYRFNLDSLLGAQHGVKEYIVAYDGIVLVTNLSNPVTELSNEQVSGIFSGNIKDWSEIGGNPGAISPVFRDQNSGTQRFFTAYFQVGELPGNSVIASDNAEIVSLVKRNPNAIGFIGFSYFSESIHSVLLESSVNTFVAPTFMNLRNNTYPLKRPLQVYFRDSSDLGLRAFLKYLNSDQAQSVLKMHGLMPQKRLVY